MGSTWLQFFTVAIPVLLAIVTGAFGWLRWRGKGEVDAQIVLNNTFALLVKELKEENRRLHDQAREKSRDHYLLQTEFGDLRIEYDVVRAHVRGLEQVIIDLGAHPPTRPEEIVWSKKKRSLPQPKT